MKRWERHRQVGRVRLFTRRDEAGCSSVVVAVPRRGRGYPHAVMQVHRYGRRQVYAFVVLGEREAAVASASLADIQPWPEYRHIGGLLVRVGRRTP